MADPSTWTFQVFGQSIVLEVWVLGYSWYVVAPDTFVPKYVAIRERWFHLKMCFVEMFPSEFELELVSRFVTFLVADQSRNNDPLFI